MSVQENKELKINNNGNGHRTKTDLAATTSIIFRNGYFELDFPGIVEDSNKKNGNGKLEEKEYGGVRLGI